MFYPLHARHVLAIALATAPFTAHASTIFSDLGPGGSYGSGDYYIYGSNGTVIFRPEYSFTATTTAALNQIDVAVTTVGIASPVNAILLSSISGAPGTILGSFSLTNLPTSGSSLATVSGITGITLNAGTNYYLGLQTASGEYSFDLNTQGVTGSLYDDESGTQYNQGTSTTGAFDLLSTPVPEPRSVALFGVGLAGLAWLRRRKTA